MEKKEGAQGKTFGENGCVAVHSVETGSPQVWGALPGKRVSKRGSKRGHRKGVSLPERPRSRSIKRIG